MMRLLTAFLAAAATLAVGAEIRTRASWIWYPEDPTTEGAGQTRYFRRSLALTAAPRSATLRLRADDGMRFYVNGTNAPAPNENGPGGAVFDLTTLLQPGPNVLAFEVTNAGGPGGLIVRGVIRGGDGAESEVLSDTKFRVAREAVDGWIAPGFDDSSWPFAKVVGSAYAPPWYRHPAFDMEPFLDDGDRQRWEAWRTPLMALPAGLQTESDATARFDLTKGTCALLINGEARPALIYRGTVDPMTEHGRRQIALFRDAGVHVYTAYHPLGASWRGPDTYEFEMLDDIVRAYLSADPDAFLILILRLVPPRWWMDAHPDELVQYARGADYNTTDESGRVRRASFASRAWQRDALAIWRAAISHLEAQPWGKRVIGYHPGYGIYTEWHYFGSWREQMPDTGPAMTTHFRQWLRDKYGNVDALRKAWRMPEADFDSATVPGVAPRLAHGRLGLRTPAEHQWVMDYYRCQQEVTVDDIELFCAAAKQITEGRALTGAFYGYFYGVHPQTQGGHLELGKLLESPHIDYFAAPYDYSHRLMGDDGRSRAVLDTFARHGKAHMIEADTRTHLHPRNEYGKLADVRESVAAIRREAATALTHGCALWWCDFGSDGSGGWYDHPDLIGEVRRMADLAERRLRNSQQRRSEVLLLCDLGSCYFLGDDDAMRTHLRLVDEVTGELYRAGVPFDTLLLSDLASSDLSHVRMLIFLNAVHISQDLRPAIRRASEGRSVLWLWAPGMTDGAAFGPDLVSDITGFRTRLAAGSATVATVVAHHPVHPLMADLPTVQRRSLAPETAAPVPGAFVEGNWYNPRSDEAMQKQYTEYAWSTADNGFRWTFCTTSSWTDIHLRAAVPACDGLQLEVGGEKGAAGTGLRVVVKAGGGGEFVAPGFAVREALQRHVLPFAAFTKAPWDRTEARRITFPLTGLKLVVDGVRSGQAGTLVVKSMESVRGTVNESRVRSYPNPAPHARVLFVDDPEAVTLGQGGNAGGVVVACKGSPGSRRVLSTVPFVPRHVLRALMTEAGVCRYVDTPGVIVRADSGLVSLHTRDAAEADLRLPFAADVRNADTGALLGRSTHAVRVSLPRVSTTLLRLEEAGR